MQGYYKNPSTMELELERVRRFSLLDCIRNEVENKIKKLPKNYGDYLKRKLDDVIALNLLHERKVRFASGRDLRDNFEKRALNEIDVLLQILGNDRKNRLVITNFDLLEHRIKSVEQRLMALIRKASGSGHGRKGPNIKIDPLRVKGNIQEFLNEFNNVFISTYGILTSSSANGTLIDETLSSKNRLKFHLLSRVSDLKYEKAYEQNMLGMKYHRKNDSSNSVLMKRALKGTKFRTMVAVDSLITLRKRVKSKSVKRKKEMEKKENKFQSQKSNQNFNKKREETKTTRKNKHISLCEQTSTPGSIDENVDFDIYDGYSNLSFHSFEDVRQKPEEQRDTIKKNQRKPFNTIPDMTTWIDNFINENPETEANTSKIFSKGDPKITQNDTLKRKFYKNVDAVLNRSYQINKDIREDLTVYAQNLEKDLSKRITALNNEKNLELSHRKRPAEESGDHFINNGNLQKFISKDSYDNRADETEIDYLKNRPKSLLATTNSKHSPKKNSTSLSQTRESQNRYSKRGDKNKRKSPPSSKYANEPRFIKTVEKHRDRKKTADTLIGKNISRAPRKSERNFKASLEAIFKRKLTESSNSSKSLSSLSSKSY